MGAARRHVGNTWPPWTSSVAAPHLVQYDACYTSGYYASRRGCGRDGHH